MGKGLYPRTRSLRALGYTVEWRDESGVRTVTLQHGGDSVVLDLTNQKIDDNGHSYWANPAHEAAIALISSRTYLESDLFDAVFTVQTVLGTDGAVTISDACENSIAVETEKTESDEGYLKLKVQYPQISGLVNTAAQDAVNAVLKQAALDAESEGRKNADAMAQWFADGYTGGPNQCETYFDYRVAYNRNGLLSVVLTDYQYTGGAHGTTVQKSYTFDLATGSELSLADLMQSGSTYRDYMNTGIRAEIDAKEAVGELAEITGSRFSDIGENPDYYLSGNGIVLYFQEYAYFRMRRESRNSQ
jgi:inhibitor of cysteine peptidase